MILSDTLLFAISMADTGAVLFLLIYYIITISDLECDYLNAQECSQRLNQWVIPKLAAHSLLTILLLMHGHWILVILNSPMLMWMIYEIVSVPGGNIGVYDPTEIHNSGKLRKHMRNCILYIAYYLLFFFAYMYQMIISMLRDNPIKDHNIDDNFDTTL